MMWKRRKKKEMAKFVNKEKSVVDEGEQVFINQTPQCLNVMMGIVFNRNGDYSVSVHEGRIIVTESLVRHGKWVEGKSDGHVICSKCKNDFDWNSEAQYFDYCPHCGARMVEDETD